VAMRRIHRACGGTDVKEALFLANRVIMLGNRQGSTTAGIPIELPYPPHRGDPCLAQLRREIFGCSGWTRPGHAMTMLGHTQIISFVTAIAENCRMPLGATVE
jgi:hypothetical protein